MLSRKNHRNFKVAAFTVEIGLSLALALVVLFSLLGLFSDSLSAMASKGGINNLFSKRPSMEQADSSWGRNPTASQVNVQIVADQGLTLNDYVNNAQATVDKYTKNPPTTEAQIQDLAKAITILSVNAGSTSGICASLRTQYGISIKLNTYDLQTGNRIGLTTVNGKTISYTATNNTDGNPLPIIKNVSNQNFS